MNPNMNPKNVNPENFQNNLLVIAHFLLIQIFFYDQSLSLKFRVLFKRSAKSFKVGSIKAKHLRWDKVFLELYYDSLKRFLRDRILRE